jgi:hypothetical protein
MTIVERRKSPLRHFMIFMFELDIGGGKTLEWRCSAHKVEQFTNDEGRGRRGGGGSGGGGKERETSPIS